ncbi:MAG: DUF2283 domain-containing protein [Calditrichota bacterium]
MDCGNDFYVGEGSHRKRIVRITYEPEVDVLYIRCVEGEHQCRTVHLSDAVALNIGPNELLVGIEVLYAKQVLGGGILPPLMLENVPLKAAG